jgi:hypothetical protein
MTKSRLLLFIAALSVLAVGLPATGQELPDSVLEIRLVDGSTLYGHVIDDGDPVRIRLLSGDEMSVARGRIRGRKQGRSLAFSRGAHPIRPSRSESPSDTMTTASSTSRSSCSVASSG